jgi:hypothetical protein
MPPLTFQIAVTPLHLHTFLTEVTIQIAIAAVAVVTVTAMVVTLTTMVAITAVAIVTVTAFTAWISVHHSCTSRFGTQVHTEAAAVVATALILTGHWGLLHDRLEHYRLCHNHHIARGVQVRPLAVTTTVRLRHSQILSRSTAPFSALSLLHPTPLNLLLLQYLVVRGRRGRLERVVHPLEYSLICVLGLISYHIGILLGWIESDLVWVCSIGVGYNWRGRKV